MYFYQIKNMYLLIRSKSRSKFGFGKKTFYFEMDQFVFNIDS